MCADLVRTVEIIFGAVDNTGTGLSSVSKSLEGAVDGASNLTKPLADVADFALKAETAILALAAVYGGYAMQKAAEFETAQIDLNKVLSEGDPAIETFTKSVMDLSEQYGVSSASILQGTANFKQAGFTAEEAALLQKNALDLMIAGDVAATDASQILISAIKGFGGEASDAARYIEALNNVSNDYATDVAQLAAGMARVAPIAHTMGFSFEETTGLLTPLIEIFGSGEAAAEALKTGLLKLIDDSKPVADALKSIGVAQTDANGQLRSGKDIFYDVATAFQHLDDKQKLFLTSQLVGIDQAPRMVLAFDNLAKIQQITSTALEKTGSVAKEVELRLDSAAKQADKFGASFDNLAITLGTKLNEQFKDVIGGSTDIVQALRSIAESGELERFFDSLKPIVSDFSETLQNIAKNLPEAFKQVDFSGQLDAFKDLGGEIGGIFAGIDLDTPEGLAKAIQFLVDSLESLTRVTSGVIESWSPLVREFVAGIEAFNGMDDASKKTFGSVSGLSDIFETFKGVLTGGLDAVNTIGQSLTAIAGLKAAETIFGISTAVKTMEFAGAFAGAEKLGAAIAFPTAAVGVASLAALAWAVKENIDAWDDYRARQQIVADSTANLAENQAKIADRLDEISQRTGITVRSMDELNKAVEDGRLVFNDATGAYEAAGSGIRDYDAEVQAAASGGGDFADAVNAVAKYLGLVSEEAKGTQKEFNTLEAAQDALWHQVKAGANVFIEYEDGLWKIKNATDGYITATEGAADATQSASKAAAEGSEEWKRVQDVLIESEKVANDFKIKMGELANQRYEIDVKAAVDLRVAEIEADTARIQSAMDATAQTIDSLTSAVAEMWKTYAGTSDRFIQHKLEEANHRMEERLEEELALKREIIEATVEKMKAETVRLQSGEPLISIDAGALAPELELVFDKILKYTQIKATQEGLALLVGI